MAFLGELALSLKDKLTPPPPRSAFPTTEERGMLLNDTGRMIMEGELTLEAYKNGLKNQMIAPGATVEDLVQEARAMGWKWENGKLTPPNLG